MTSFSVWLAVSAPRLPSHWDLGGLWDLHWMRALIFVVLTLFVTFIVDVNSWRILKRIGRGTKGDLDDIIIGMVHRPMSISVWLIGMWYAIQPLSLSHSLQHLLRGLFLTIAVGAWSWTITKRAGPVMDYLARRQDRFGFIQPRTKPIFNMAFQLVVIGGALYCLLLTWGVNVSAWLASAGIIGMAIGFAAQNTLSDLLAGLSIIADSPYKIGDFLVLDSGRRGRVTVIGMRSTRLLTLDGVEVVLPNAMMAGSVITNVSGGPSEQERLRISVGVAYGSDIDHVKKVLKEEAVQVDGVRTEESWAPHVGFVEFGDSALALELRVWIKTPELRATVIDALHTAIYRRFNTEGIEIPFAQHDVHLHHEPPAGSSQTQ